MIKIKYTIDEDKYLEDKFKKLTALQIGINLGRSEASVYQRLHAIREKGTIGYKLIPKDGNEHQLVANSPQMRLLTQGQKNKIDISQAKEKIVAGQYLKIMVGTKVEKCLVEFVTESYFSVKRKNYRDSFKFIELMQGTVTILV